MSCDDIIAVDTKDVEYLYDLFHSSLSADLNYIEFEQFLQSLFVKSIPEWKDIPGLVDFIFMVIHSIPINC